MKKVKNFIMTIFAALFILTGCGKNTKNISEGQGKTIETCPGCKFIYTTKLRAIEGSNFDRENVDMFYSDMPEGTTNDYTTLTSTGEHQYFLGIIESTTTPGKIGRAFVCGVENGKAFCLEGYDASKYAESNITTLNTIYPSCNASASDSVAHCYTSFKDVAIVNDSGSVSIGDCHVTSEGGFRC